MDTTTFELFLRFHEKRMRGEIKNDEEMKAWLTEQLDQPHAYQVVSFLAYLGFTKIIAEFDLYRSIANTLTDMPDWEKKVKEMDGALRIMQKLQQQGSAPSENVPVKEKPRMKVNDPNPDKTTIH